MGQPKLLAKVSVEDYLEGEKTSYIRHEYLNGQVHAISGANIRHNRISRNLLERLIGHLKESDCEPFYNEVKVRLAKPNRFYYPDLVVSCETIDEKEYYPKQPKVIIEVLSPTTALTDKREKWFAYQEIESLQEYVMIYQDSEHAEVYRRRDDGLWSFIEFNSNEELELNSIDFKTPIVELYK